MKELKNFRDVLKLIQNNLKGIFVVFIISFFLFQCISYIQKNEYTVTATLVDSDNSSNTSLSLFESSNENLTKEVFLFNLSSNSTAQTLLESNEFSSFETSQLRLDQILIRFLNQEKLEIGKDEALQNMLKSKIRYEIRDKFIVIKFSSKNEENITNRLKKILKVADQQTKEQIYDHFISQNNFFLTQIKQEENLELKDLYRENISNNLNTIIKIKNEEKNLFFTLELTKPTYSSSVLSDSIIFSILVIFLYLLRAYYRD